MKVIISEKNLMQFVNKCVDFDRKYNSDRPDDVKFVTHSDMSIEELLNKAGVEYELSNVRINYLPDYAIDALRNYAEYLNDVADSPTEEDELALITDLLKYYN